MTDKDDELLADLLLRWEELREQGQDVSALELCQGCPHLADELGHRITAMKATSWLDTPIDDFATDFTAATDTPTLAPQESRTLVDRYRLDDLIAEGGFAQVWRAYDLELHRSVAVKVPKPSRLDSADAFMAEARRVARLKHPGIVPVHDVVREKGTCFIVSEFVEGGNLVARRPLEPRQAIRWAIDIAEALEYAHASGIIHRDIKPANILIDHHGRALVADFGIARSTIKTGETTPSIGTLRYMSPEQLESKEVDARSDIYSLGIVLYELLTGKLPYSSTDPNVLRREIVTGAKVGPENMPAELRRICLKALERDPAARYTTAAELAADLRMSLVKTSTRWMVFSAVGAVFFLAVVGLALWSPKKEPAPERTPIKAAVIIDESWFTHVGALPAQEQVQAVSEKLKELNDGFNGDVKETIEDGVVVGLELLTDNVTDISPLKALTELKSLVCEGTYTTRSNGRLADLSPLKVLKLTKLFINYNELLSDLSPLEGMPLTSFHCGRTNVADLSPLKDMPLTFLICSFNNVTNLSPLKGMKLTEFYCDHTRIADLGPVAGMPLEKVRCHDTLVSSLAPLQGSPLKTLECHRSEVADLTPLKGMNQLYGLNVLSTKVTDFSPLKEMTGLKLLWCDFVENRDAAHLRSVKSLEQINGNPAAAFRQELDNKRSDMKPATVEEALLPASDGKE